MRLRRTVGICTFAGVGTASTSKNGNSRRCEERITAYLNHCETPVASCYYADPELFAILSPSYSSGYAGRGWQMQCDCHKLL